MRDNNAAKKIRSIPFVDLESPHRACRNMVNAAISRVVDSSFFLMGPEVEAFEDEFAHYCRVPHCIGVSSGSDALTLALQACGVGPGDEVITVSHAFISTAEAIWRVGATPVFVDIDGETLTMNIDELEPAITPQTKAVVPVHIYGQCVDMDPLMIVAGNYNLMVIEEVSHAPGAMYKARKAGSMGDVGCFSFYPTKNLGAFGDGGAVVTKNAFMAKRMRMLRNHGQDRTHHHSFQGFSCRLDEIQAAILRVKLKTLDEMNHQRMTVAARYGALLQDYVRTPVEHPDNSHVYHSYVVLAEERDALKEYLGQRGISTMVHYQVPIHQQEAYCSRDGLPAIESLPVTERVSDELLSLPMHPYLEAEEVTYIAEAIKEFYGMG